MIITIQTEAGYGDDTLVARSNYPRSGASDMLREELLSMLARYERHGFIALEVGHVASIPEEAVLLDETPCEDSGTPAVRELGTPMVVYYEDFAVETPAEEAPAPEPPETVATETAQPETEVYAEAAAETSDLQVVEEPPFVPDFPAPEPEPEHPRYDADLPQTFEFLRESLTAIKAHGADDAVQTMLLQAAVEARDYAKLPEWRKVVEPGVIASLTAGRHPNEFVPAMIAAVRKRVLETGVKSFDEDTQRVLRQIMVIVPEVSKNAHREFIDNALHNGSHKYFVEAWAEAEDATRAGRASSPWHLWKSIVTKRHEQDEFDRMRAPIKLNFPDTIAWVKEWFPAFQKESLNRDNIEREFQPISRRTSVERRVEAAYFTLLCTVKEKEQGVPVDVLVDAWCAPENTTDLYSIWMNVLAASYERDGKRLAYSKQQFDVHANAFFLDVLQNERCKPWVEQNREALRTHSRIGEVYAKVFKDENNA